MNKTILPEFSQINIETIESELDALLSNNRRKIDSLLKTQSPYTWDNLMQPIEALDDQLSRFWSPVSHMHSVVSNDELRKVYQACLYCSRSAKVFG